jgi:hypothetical protein
MSKHKRQPYKPIDPNQYDGQYSVEVLTDRHVNRNDSLTGGTAVTNHGLLIEWRLVGMGSGRGEAHIRYFNHGANLATATVESHNPGISSAIVSALNSMHPAEHCSYWYDDELMADKSGECALQGEALEKAAHEKRLQLAQEAEKQYNAWHTESNDHATGKDGTKPPEDQPRS